MAENGKLKVLYILDIMHRTDEMHPINATQIANKLVTYGITAERKSIIRDLQCLEDAGYSIVKCENHNRGWYMTDQEFEDYELKMLVDAVARAKFQTMEDSRSLIKKIKKLSTREGEKLIDATTILDPSIKIVDSKFKLKYDLIMRAISDKKQIRFQYYELTKGNKKVFKRNGYVYQISPYYVALDGDEYFVIGNPNTHNHATHFRIEMMDNVESTDEIIRPREDVVELSSIGRTMTIGDYLRANVNMWTGESKIVKLRCTNGCRHDLMVKYGKDIQIRDDGDEHFITNITVSKNEGFYQWLAAYGPYVVILGPDDMRQHFIEYLRCTLENYE